MEAVPNLPQNWWKFNSYNIYVDENEINMIKRDIQSPVFNLAGFNFPAQQAPAPIRPPAQLLPVLQPPVFNLGGFNLQPPPGNN